MKTGKMDFANTKMPHQEPTHHQAKAFGAYYTDAQIADFLAWWAIRSSKDTVMDPSFGGGVFLRSACKRLTRLRSNARAQVFGVELDDSVHSRIADKLEDEYSLLRQNLILADFFALVPGSKLVDAIIGNPPFIRYQRFSGESRKLALARTLSQGVKLPELASSWAPFLVHSVSMLKPGGRLAMVLPMEVSHARYARPVLEHLRQSFQSACFLTFRKKLFPDLSEDTLLLLADGKGLGPASFSLRDLASPGSLNSLMHKSNRILASTAGIDAVRIASGQSRLIEQLIPAKARELYRRLKASNQTQRLGDIADVGIGYVTGANDFFHLDCDSEHIAKIPPQFLKRAVRRGRALSGLRFTDTDWEIAATHGEAGYLLHIQKNQSLPASVKRYIQAGEAHGIQTAYKCRSRSPWFCVPHVYEPDAFLTYMSGITPRLVANDSNAYAPNSLHILRMHSTASLCRDGLAALWQTSLTQLSAEIEGHALGGGMLKLEPTEAENVLLPASNASKNQMLLNLAEEADKLIRKKDDSKARKLADDLILRKTLGLSSSDCELLRTAVNALRSRRGYKEVSIAS